MKKTFIALLLSTSLLFLVGCGSKDNETSNNNSNEQTQSTDRNSTEKQDSDSKVNKEDKETASKESENNSAEKDEKATITIFMPNATADGLNSKDVTVNHLTAYSIVNSLAENKVVPSGTRALKFEIKDNVGYLDVSSSIYNLHSGSSGETLMLNSIRETFAKAFNVQKVKLTVDGSTYTGSHVDLGPNDFL